MRLTLVRRPAWRPAVLAACVVTFALTACSSSQASDVSATAEDFYAAVAAQDGAVACGLLSADSRTELEQAAGKPCPEAVLSEDLPQPQDVGSPEVFGTMAFVPAEGDRMFLGRFPEGWLVTAVGCELTDKADRYDCSVAGG